MIADMYGCHQTPQITGLDVACKNQEITFNLENIPTDHTITWKARRGFQVISSSNNSITLLTPSRPAFDSWVEATITTPSGDTYTIRKEFWVGYPSVNTIREPVTDQNGEICVLDRKCFLVMQSIHVEADGLGNCGYYEWEKVYGNFDLYIEDNIAYISAQNTGSISLRVRAVNNCGSSAWNIYNYEVVNCNSDPFLTDIIVHCD
jgi:FlaG/FlaF family flagellin (archaellin)